MTPIQGSSTLPDDNITPINKPDIEYDELHHYEKPSELEQPKPEVPKGHILIDDMTIEQLRNCVRNLADANKSKDVIIADYKGRAREIEKRLCDKKWVKARYENLRDHPEGNINGATTRRNN